MKERPILFSTPMVQAILAGRKTQTRRVAKHVKELNIESYERNKKLFTSWSVKFEPAFRKIRASHSGGLLSKEEALRFISNEFCPYGRIGDRLWVREAWRVHSKATDLACVVYRASENDSWTNFHKYFPVELAKNQKAAPCGWKPSIHMPRCASRILLEITDVRIERLQDISEADAVAEGVEPITLDDGWPQAGLKMWKGYKNHARAYRDTATDSFTSLWESINGVDSWSANPWVWVVEFKVVQGGAA